MSAVSAWLLSIAGVVIICVLAELILPDGQINKYIKVIFSFVTLFIVISPLPKLFGKEINFNKFFGQDQSLVQEDYLYQLNIDKLEALNTDITDEIKNKGLSRVKLSINANVLSEKLEILGVYVDLREIEYNANFGSKDIAKAKAVIKEIVVNHLGEVEVKFDD